jgi:hypothetical protein
MDLIYAKSRVDHIQKRAEKFYVNRWFMFPRPVFLKETELTEVRVTEVNIAEDYVEYHYWAEAEGNDEAAWCVDTTSLKQFYRTAQPIKNKSNTK